MASVKICVLFVFSCCLWNSSIAVTRSVRIPLALAGVTTTRNEDDLYQRFEFMAESLGFDGTTVAPVEQGDLEIAYVVETLDGSTGMPDVEPGFDFTPDLGPLPATFTVTIKEGESESELFVLQILDDCHHEIMAERFTIRPVGTIAYTNVGTSYSVVQSTATFEIVENLADTAGDIVIHMDPEFPTVGFVFFEGEPNPAIPIKGLECGDSRELPLDDICTASINPVINVANQFSIPNEIVLESDDEDFPISVIDDTTPEDPMEVTSLQFAGANCLNTPPANTAHSLDDTELFIFTIIDDDESSSYGIVYPAAIVRKESRDVNVYAVTTQVNTPTVISRNDAVCPYTKRLPLCKSTDLKCGPTDTFGQCTTFPKPKRQSRDRFGSYILSAQFDPIQTFPVFVRALSDVLNPLNGPTITINNLEDVVIGVQFSDFVRELRWYFNGKELPEYRGKCNFKIKSAEYGVHAGYYEVHRVQRGDSGYLTIIRLIIRRCGANQYFDGTSCTAANNPAVCYNGGVLRNEEDVCECPLGFYGPRCATVDPKNFRVGPLGKRLNCRDISKDIPRDCEGALFCFRDPLGCLCARGYWGPECDRVCPHGRYGWSCLQHCHCVGPWDSCNPKTGICKSGECDSDYGGPNCQQPDD